MTERAVVIRISDYSWIDSSGAANSCLKIVDPDGGKTYDESFQDFTSKYEAMADATGWNLQMMHD